MNLAAGRGAALALAVLVAACAQQPSGSDDYDRDAATDEIWAKEQAIYAARGDGDLQFYVDSASEHYMGWPPGWPKPSGIDQLRAGVELMRGLDQEELAMEFGDITFSGNTAIIYYSTHRTRMPTGEEVDQRFHIVHIWAREQGEWKLLGALGREATPPAGDSEPGGSAADEKAAAKEAIWAKEQAVYAARRRADPQFYIDNASEQYVGWSPNWDSPEGLDLLRAGVSRVQGQVHEELSLVFEDIAVSGDAAVIYYSTHRTRLPTGEDVNQRFQIAHTWVREGDEWKLLGALGRAASPPYDEEQARAEIWAKEQAIFAGRAEGDIQYYVDNASDQYLGWPPGWTKPSGIDQLRAGAAQMRGMNQEELTLELDGISFDGNTAISFFSTHRTRMPGGEAVDQRYENIHVWVYGNGRWRLLSSMGRPLT